MSSDQNPPLIDVDCNLMHADLKSLFGKANHSPLDILFEDAVRDHNIVAMLSPSSTIQEAKNGLAFFKDQSSFNILTTIGVHPYQVPATSPSRDVYDEMKLIVQENPTLVCAVGECGLDTSPGFPPLDHQIPWFQQQIQFAKDMQLPLFVHERGAFEVTMNLLQSFTGKVIIHCFTGTAVECQQYIERGYSISLSGYICKPTDTRECVPLIPLSQLMLETDAPYMGFATCRQLYLDKNMDSMATLNSKQRKRLTTGTYPNVPSSLPKVLDQVVELLDGTYTREEVARQTTENAIAFFGFKV